MKKLIYFLITIFCFLSCHKDIDITPIIGDCNDDDFPEPSRGTSFTYNDPKEYPVSVNYNPTNPNELIVSWKTEKTGRVDVYVYDREKRKKRLLIENLFCGSNISQDGWIAFCKDNALWKIKTDGSQLTKIADFLVCGLDWNPDGTMLSFFADSKIRVIQNGIVQTLDDLYGLNAFATHAKWDYSGTKIALSNTSVSIYDTITKEYTKLEVIDGANPGIAWLRNGHEILWNNWSGIYKTDIYTQATTQIRDICRSRVEGIMMQSQDGSKLIGIRYDYRYVGKKKYDIDSDIYVIEMNTDGSNERRIWID